MTEYLSTHASPGPVGHGYTPAAIASDIGYYAVDHGGVRCISLDTVDPTGYDDGSIDKTQLAWLTAELNAHSSRYLDTNGNWVTGTGTDKLIMIFSHHTSWTMENELGPNRVIGSKVVALLLQYPNVIAWINGHTHDNTVLAHQRALPNAFPGGFWEINTASHVDWPSQSRAIEVVNNGNGTASVFGTIFDHAAPLAWAGHPTTPLQLAALGRELAINDPQRDAETSTRDGKRGTVSDRNVELLVKVAFPL
jgi:metallophosphoesterase (TIGR03767 family)